MDILTNGEAYNRGFFYSQTQDSKYYARVLKERMIGISRCPPNLLQEIEKELAGYVNPPADMANYGVDEAFVLGFLIRQCPDTENYFNFIEIAFAVILDRPRMCLYLGKENEALLKEITTKGKQALAEFRASKRKYEEETNFWSFADQVAAKVDNMPGWEKGESNPPIEKKPEDHSKPKLFFDKWLAEKMQNPDFRRAYEKEDIETRAVCVRSNTVQENTNMSTEYHKIQSVYMRDEKTHGFTAEYATDEIRMLAGHKWRGTEKVNGTNIRIDWDSRSGIRTFGGKTDNAAIPAVLVKHLENTFTPERLKAALGDIGSVTLYGEGYGRGIGKYGNVYDKDNVHFILFDIFYRGEEDLWLTRDSVDDIARKLQIPSVSTIGYFTLPEAVEFVKKGFTSKLGDFPAEGLVLVPEGDFLSRRGERIITKIKTADFKGKEAS